MNTYQIIQWQADLLQIVRSALPDQAGGKTAQQVVDYGDSLLNAFICQPPPPEIWQ